MNAETEEEKLEWATREINAVLKKYGLMGMYVLGSKNYIKSGMEMPKWAVLRKVRYSDGSHRLKPNPSILDLNEALPGLEFYWELKDMLVTWWGNADIMEREFKRLGLHQRAFYEDRTEEHEEVHLQAG